MRINKSETCNDFSVDLVQSDYGSAWILASPAIHLDITLTATYIRRTPQISMFRTLSELPPGVFLAHQAADRNDRKRFAISNGSYRRGL
jgi:hypothetical protein